MHHSIDLFQLPIYNKTSIERNILTIKKIYREVRRAKDLSAPLYISDNKSRLFFHSLLELKNSKARQVHFSTQKVPNRSNNSRSSPRV